MNIRENINNWYENGGNEKIRMFFEDVEGIFSTDKGNGKGVYGVYVKTPIGKEIPMYIGEVGKEERCFKDRLIEHAKHWIENPLFYTGLTLLDLVKGNKYLVRILAVEGDDEKRYALEQKMIEEQRPFLQYSCYPKFRSDYYGNDLCIFGTYRRRAFIVARDGMFTENELVLENIFKKGKDELIACRNAYPNKEVMELVKEEMPKGSDICRAVKRYIESKMGITSERGYSYTYLVKIIATALERDYFIKEFR